ncbi:MAG: RNA-binding domain-containing protein [Nitrososphaeria archaeon]
MKVPSLNLDVRVQVSAVVHKSEDPSKVAVAARNISGGLEPNYVEENEAHVILEYDDERALYNMYRRIRERQVLSAARRLLLENVVKNETTIMLNRQAAYVGDIVFCEEEAESPLGPIYVKMSSPRILEVIEWLASEPDVDVMAGKRVRRP